MSATEQVLVRSLFRLLYRHFGPQGWWPARTPCEVIVGAVLTQNTNWGSVERAIRNLRAARALSLRGVLSIRTGRLQRLIRPAGYYRLKAQRLRNTLGWLMRRCGGRLTRLRQVPQEQLREELLRINGVGPETADSILLYAFARPVFVVDAYTKRVLARHRLLPEDVSYEEAQKFFMKNLKKEVQLFNEYHALFVRVAKEYCHKQHPRCGECPLRGFPAGKRQ